jgi:hypothetical protein
MRSEYNVRLFVSFLQKKLDVIKTTKGRRKRDTNALMYVYREEARIRHQLSSRNQEILKNANKIEAPLCNVYCVFP